MARVSSPRDSLQRSSSVEGRSGLWLLLAFLILLFAAPLLLQNRSNECSALEAKAIRLGTASSGQFMLATALQGFSNGALANAALAEKFPAIPTPISCTYEYWILTFDRGASI